MTTKPTPQPQFQQIQAFVCKRDTDYARHSKVIAQLLSEGYYGEKGWRFPEAQTRYDEVDESLYRAERKPHKPTPQPPQADKGAEPFAGHTPGPWRVHNGAIRSGEGDHEIIVAVPKSGWLPEWYALNTHEAARLGGQMREANARLIAAAPSLAASHRELVEALRETQAICLNVYAQFGAVCWADGLDTLKVIDRAEAALAEAEKKLASGGSL